MNLNKNITEYETRITYGNKEELHLVVVEVSAIPLNGDMVLKDKYVEVYNLDGKCIMKLTPSDVRYLGILCDAIRG